MSFTYKEGRRRQTWMDEVIIEKMNRQTLKKIRLLSINQLIEK